MSDGESTTYKRARLVWLVRLTMINNKWILFEDWLVPINEFSGHPAIVLQLALIKVLLGNFVLELL